MARKLSETLRGYCTVRFLKKYDQLFSKSPSNKLEALSKKWMAATAKEKLAREEANKAWDEYMAFTENQLKYMDDFHKELAELEALVSNITESSAVHSLKH